MFEKNAIINFNKPTGMSSFFAVKKVARLLGVKKAGHMGTLDPYGTGVLLIGVNKGTKLFEEYLNKTKTYIATFHFSYETDTLDSEGNIVNEDNKIVTKEMILSIINEFIGKIQQMPPQFSAKKVNGKKAYELAREGKSVELKPKEVEVYSLKLINCFEDNTFVFEISCSAGTYIRSLCRDIAYKMSTYGTMLSIIRTTCDSFNINDSCTLQDIQEGRVSYLEV